MTSSRTTRKVHSFSSSSLKGRILGRKEGWIHIHICGKPFERGFAHGALLHRELKRCYYILPFLLKTVMKTSPQKHMEKVMQTIKPSIAQYDPEIYEEMRGISEGAISRGATEITLDFLMAWNSLYSFHSYYHSSKLHHSRCCAFIATGEHTEKGNIVMAHNTHCDFVSAQVFNIHMKITPSTGGEFVMQTAPGYVASGTDWFLCKSGIIGCETTISGMKFPPRFGRPYFCRVRKAMQYATSLNECKEMMIDNNAGDYACSWLFGDIKTKEIMRLELGVFSHSIQRTFNGAYYGANSAMDPNFRALETDDKDHHDLRKSVGARGHRLNELVNNQYRGKLNTENAKAILSDHYDVYTNVEHMNSRTICKHVELDGEDGIPKKFFPSGCVDGKVVDAAMAKKLHCYARFGSSCGRAFDAASFIRQHSKYEKWEPYLVSFPRKRWVLL